MSTTASEINNIIDFHEKRRERVIRALIDANRLPRVQIEKIIDMHNFLSDVDSKTRSETVDKETLANVEDEVVFVREKFNELFEMIKNELLI